jgi:hypothetical protein
MPRSDEIDNARVGYQVALTYVTYWGGVNWSMFNAMIVANSVVVTGIAFAYSSTPPVPHLKLLLAITGLIFCAAWSLMLYRSHRMNLYYLLSAREIEELYLQPVKTLSRGGSYADGEQVTLKIDGKNKPLQIRAWFLKNQYVSTAVILAFVLGYLGIIFELIKNLT